MPPRKQITPQVPGEFVANGEVLDESTPVVDPANDEQVTVSKSTLDALMARVNALESQPKAKRGAVKSAALPDQDDINPAKIKSPVLTSQGWVVPEQYGANPAAPKVG